MTTDISSFLDSAEKELGLAPLGQETNAATLAPPKKQKKSITSFLDNTEKELGLSPIHPHPMTAFNPRQELAKTAAIAPTSLPSTDLQWKDVGLQEVELPQTAEQQKGLTTALLRREEVGALFDKPLSYQLWANDYQVRTGRNPKEDIKGPPLTFNEARDILGIEPKPILGDILNIANLTVAMLAMDRLRKNADKDYPGRESDEEAMYEYQHRQQILQNRGMTKKARIALGALGLLPYMASFWASGPLTVGVEVAKKKALGKVSGIAAKTGIKLGASVVSAGARLPAFSPYIAQEYLEERIAGNKPATAIFRATGRVLTMVYAEQAGGTITKGATKAASIIPGVNKLAPVLQKVWTNATGKTGGEFLRRAATELGLHSLLGELSEEQLEATLLAATGLERQDKEDNRSYMERVMDSLMTPEELGVAGAVLAIPGAARVGGALWAGRGQPKLAPIAEGEPLTPAQRIEAARTPPAAPVTLPVEAKPEVAPQVQPAPEVAPAAQPAPKQPWEIPLREYAGIEPKSQARPEGTKVFRVDYMIRGMEPPYPHGKMSTEVVANTPQEAIHKVPDISPRYKPKAVVVKGKVPPATRYDTEAQDAWEGKTSDHAIFVKRASAEGKPVPAEVLADYPDLAAKGKPVQIVTPLTQEIPSEKQTPIPVQPSGQVAERPAGPLVYEISKVREYPETGTETIKLDPTVPEQAKQIIADYGRKQGIGAPGGNPAVDQAYETIAVPVESGMADTQLFALPGKEAEMTAIAEQMRKAQSGKPGVVKTFGPSPRLTPTKLPAVKKGFTQADQIKSVARAAAKEDSRYAITGITVDGKNLVATDGRRLFILEGEWGKDGLYEIDKKGNKLGIKEGKFPTYQDIVPEIDPAKPTATVNVEETFRRLSQAATLTSENSQGVITVVNPDGTLGFVGRAAEYGEAQVNIQPGFRQLGGINPYYLQDALRFAHENGQKTVNLWWEDATKPVVIKAGPTTSLTMPISLTGAEIAPKIVTPRQQIEGAVEQLKGKISVPLSLEPTATKPANPTEIVKQMESLFGVPIRTGRFRQQAAGIYKRQPQVVRTKEFADLGAASHEVSHHLYYDLKLGRTIPKELRAEIKALDYEPEKARLNEGFAEFMRHYLTTGEAANKAPRFNEWFEQQLPNSKYAKAVQQTKDLIDAWRQSGAVARVTAQIDRAAKPAELIKEGFKTAPSLWDKFLTAFVNRQQPLWDAQATMAGTKSLAEIPAEYRFAQFAKVANMAAPSKARQWALTGARDVSGNRVGPSLKEILAPINADLQTAAGKEQFDAYIYAQHAIDVHAAGKNPGIDLADAKYVVRQFENNPGWKQAAKGVTEWHDKLLDYLIDAGGLTGEAKATMRALYPNYVPLRRAIENQGLRAGGKRLADLPSPIMRLKGSARAIMPPLESSIVYAERIIALADKIRVGKMLVVAAEYYGGMGKLVEKVSPALKPVSTDLQRIKTQLERLGADLSDTDLESVVTVFENLYRGSSKDNIIALIRNGKREMYQVDPELYKALTSVDQQFQLPKVLDWVFGKPARTLRLGATGLRASFGLITNPLRDVQTATMQTRAKGWRGTLPSIIQRSFSAVVDDVSGGKISELFKAGGGEMAQPLAIDRRFTQKILDEVLAVNPKNKVLNWSRHPIESLRKVFSVTELGPRIAEFKQSLEEGGWKEGQPVTFRQYLDAQMRAANVSVDFREGGYLSMWLNRMTAFHNASIQGPNRMVQTFKTNPAGTAIKTVSWLLLPKLAEWYLYKDDDWYKDLPDFEKWRYYHIKVGGAILRIPAPFEWGLIGGSLPVAAIESIYTNSAEPIKNAIEQAVRALIPPLLPTAAGPAIEVVANKDFFRGRPIESKGEEYLKPEERYNQYTSETAKGLGSIFGLSPKKIEHLISGYTGGLGLDVLQDIEAPITIGKPGRPSELTDIPIAGRLFLRQTTTRVFDDFYDKYGQAEQEMASAKKREREPVAEQVAGLTQMRQAAKQLAQGRKQIGEIVADAKLPAAAKRTQILDIHSNMLQIAKSAMQSNLSPSTGGRSRSRTSRTREPRR